MGLIVDTVHTYPGLTGGEAEVEALIGEPLEGGAS
jgi:hypothetical protein